MALAQVHRAAAATTRDAEEAAAPDARALYSFAMS